MGMLKMCLFSKWPREFHYPSGELAGGATCLCGWLVPPHSSRKNLHILKFMYFIFGCTGGFVTAPGLSLVGLRGPLNHRGLSGRRAQALGTRASATVAQGLRCPTAEGLFPD